MLNGVERSLHKQVFELAGYYGSSWKCQCNADESPQQQV